MGKTDDSVELREGQALDGEGPEDVLSAGSVPHLTGRAPRETCGALFTESALYPNKKVQMKNNKITCTLQKRYLFTPTLSLSRKGSGEVRGRE